VRMGERFESAFILINFLIVFSQKLITFFIFCGINFRFLIGLIPVPEFTIFGVGGSGVFKTGVRDRGKPRLFQKRGRGKLTRGVSGGGESGPRNFFRGINTKKSKIFEPKPFLKFFFDARYYIES